MARNQGKVATLAVLLPPLAGISFEDMAAFEASYQAYKQHLATRQPAAAELLAALALALQLGDAALVQAIAAQQAPQPLLAQLIEQYPLATEALHARLASLLPETVAEHSQPALEKAA